MEVDIKNVRTLVGQLKKYGRENFQPKILYDNDNLTQTEANELEERTIDEYNKIKDDKQKIKEIVHNVNYMAVDRHAVVQYDFNMNLISEYSSILEVYKSTKVDRKAIKYVREGNRNLLNGTYGDINRMQLVHN